MLVTAPTSAAFAKFAGLVIAIALLLTGRASLTAQPGDGDGDTDNGNPTADWPYPADERDGTYYYQAYTGWPRTLDPALSYSSEEGAILDLIVEPPLGYHALRRPHELVPRTARRVPVPVHVVLYPKGDTRPHDLTRLAKPFDYSDQYAGYEVPPDTAHDAARYFREVRAVDDACWGELDVLERTYERILDATAQINDGRRLAEVGAAADLKEATEALMRLYDALEHGAAACGFRPPDAYPFNVPGQWADAFAAWATGIRSQLVRSAASEMASAVSAANVRVHLVVENAAELPMWLADSAGYRYVIDIEIQPGIYYQPHPCFARGDDGRFLYHAGWQTDIASYRAWARTLLLTPDIPEALQRSLRLKLDRNGPWNPDVLHELTFPTDLGRLETGTRELTAADYVLQIKRLAAGTPIADTLERHVDGFMAYQHELYLDWYDEDTACEQLMPGVDREDRPFIPLRYNFARADLPGVRELDRYTYRVALVQPYRAILNWLAMAFFGPTPWEALSFYAQPALKGSYVWMESAPVGTGAFRLTRLDDEQVRVERNPSFNPRGPNDGAAPPAVVDRNGNGKLDPGEQYWDDINRNGKHDALDPFGRMFEGLYFEDRNRDGAWDEDEIWYELPASYRTVHPLDGAPEDQITGLLKDAGRRLPLVDGFVQGYPCADDDEYWARFLAGWYDATPITADRFDEVIEFDERGQPQLRSDYAARGLTLERYTDMSNRYWAFNMADPVVGGSGERARKIRQAIAIAFDTEQWIERFLNGRAVPAQGPIPPGIFGGPTLVGDEPLIASALDIDPIVYDAVPVKKDARVIGYRAVRRSIDVAKRLMTEAGWPEGVNANGERLSMRFDSALEDEAQRDWVVAQFAKLGIALECVVTDYSEFQRLVDRGEHQFVYWGWNADYPDPENFLQLLYGPNNASPLETDWTWGGSNTANYTSSAYDRLFLQCEHMLDSADRRKLIHEALTIAREDCPWIWGYYPEAWSLRHGWLDRKKPNLLSRTGMLGWHVDPEARHTYRLEHAED